ncbi:hypothetical protein [Solwaraspora sp. WMMD792]|uniref:hypothetical protein n=1 Tax=Solwaraspora sp. WMMD792 TaxID=3016099 RepID=UPI0024172E3C|nr:hypothetical protein [Solwaraspora sp. WMMD792]MDG4771841.1 hypothetical protein [Solwaraspora sp. WMMD792]
MKRTLTVSGKDAQFVSVVIQALHVLHERPLEVARGDLDIGLIARGDPQALDQLAELAVFARAHTVERTFAAVFSPGVVELPLRTRLDQVRMAVRVAIVEGAPDLGGVDVTTHAFLSALHVWRVADGDDGPDFLAALDRLTPIATSFGVNAIEVFGHLAALAEGWGVVAGVVNADSIRRQLRRRGLGLKRTEVGAIAGTRQIDADAVVRGPVAALELDSAIEKAERLLDAGDPLAASLFAEAARQLEERNFGPHAAIMRRREADARQQTGQADDAVISRVSLAWMHLELVQPWEAGFALRDGRQIRAAKPPSPSACRITRAANAAVWVAKGSSLDDLISAFDALEDGDPCEERVAAFLCEEAIASARTEVVLDRTMRLEKIARLASGRTELATQRCGARIKMCIADAAGRWATLLPEIHREYPRQIVAWAHARWGRYLALSGDGPGAMTQYLQAIERACVAEMFDEAADWLYALRTVRHWYTDLGPDEQHPLAQALRANAKPSQLPGSPHSAEQALRALADEKRPGEALQKIYRWRWQSTVRAQLTEEIEAVKSLGSLFLRHNETLAAIECFVRSAAIRDAAAAACRLPDAVAHFDLGMLAPVEGIRASAYAAVAAAADLISDDDGKDWLDAAITEVMRGDERSRASSAASVHALDALAALCDVMTDDQIDQLIPFLEVMVDGSTNGQRYKGEAIAKILIAVAARRSNVVSLLIRALLADRRMADVILARAIETFKVHREIVTKLLAPAAAANEYACLALILMGADVSQGRAFARSRVDRYLLPRDQQPGSITDYSGASDIAIFASVFDLETRNRVALAMLDRVLDGGETPSSRRDSLRGLMRISSYIDGATRAALLRPVLEVIRREEIDGSPDGADGMGGPFDMVRIDLGPQGIADLALQCVASLDLTESDQREIWKMGTSLFRTADESSQWCIGRALALLPAAPSGLVSDYLVVHPSPVLRALAALCWTRNRAAFPVARAVQLAQDGDYRVRRVFAQAIRENCSASVDEEVRLLIDVLASDLRRSVRSGMADFAIGA